MDMSLQRDSICKCEVWYSSSKLKSFVTWMLVGVMYYSFRGSVKYSVSIGKAYPCTSVE